MSLKQIKAKLSECAKNGKPVLLHGICNIDYKKIVLDIHKANGGIGEVLEIMGDEPRDEQGIDAMLRAAWKSKDIKRVEEFIFNCRNTSRTYKYYDFDCMYAKDVFDTLLVHNFYKSDYIKELMSSIYWGWNGLNREIDLEPPIINDKRIGYTLASPIFRKGLLFLDNLYCRKDNGDDFESYRAFADVIKIRETKGKFKPHLQYSYSLGNTFISDDGNMKDWLVTYTQSPTVFPDYFVKQFEQILLDGEEEDVKPIKEIAESKDDYVFRKDGEDWIVQFKNEQIKSRHRIGMEYIVHLLKNPYPNQFTPKQLYQEVNKAPKLPDENEQEAIEEAFIEGDLTIESQGEYADIVDDETKKMINELEDKKNIAESTGNEAEAKDLKSQINDLEKEYVRKLMKRGKSLKFPSSTHKKPYDAINNAISRVLEKIEEQSKEKQYNSKLTWKHLTNSIKYKDSNFYYSPEILPKWQF